ncbi:MAG TPA: 2-phosphosulfolactate phosphatase [Bacteroidales bacterium]|nr:2-phosphosulfolactate phosphatase [Bacteroidales bacterium]
MYNETGKYSIEVCFSPLSWPLFEKENAVIVITDIFRASTAICTAFHFGVKCIIPVAEISESEAYKKMGFIVAGERDGKKLECADFGNSPFNFMDPSLKGKTIVLNTTNGTQAINAVSNGNNHVVIGSFLNLGSVVRYVAEQRKKVVVFCSGWKNRFSIEDTLFAGALVESLIDYGKSDFHTICDSAIASFDLWLSAKTDLPGYIEKAAHRHRLRKMGLDDILEFTFQIDYTDAVPVLNGRELVNAKAFH